MATEILYAVATSPLRAQLLLNGVEGNRDRVTALEYVAEAWRDHLNVLGLPYKYRIFKARVTVELLED